MSEFDRLKAQKDAIERKNADRELGAIAKFVREVDDAIVDWVHSGQLRVDGILKARKELVEVCVGYVPNLSGEDYADHADNHRL